ncbi:putative uncharacterized protein DDB_G0282129 [Octopus bimaculoides]|uniref:Centriolar coiled-coil protein of 110 kDa n=1 Tax=Octopus bimaculoides TaxID=37653 RepID=A0A0L8I9T1_OCTBM|nr:putative uncharacterized protein DDB_G0282129 [Octopus bimaculoides]|eukprot:XP_014783811.1 PREDICTED: putative uncharacterized protein DDB_G0282129 [Octopus bimaculoides]
MALAGQHNLSDEEENQNKYFDLLSQIPQLLTQIEEHVLSPTDPSESVSYSSNPSNSKPYVSCIKINGVPILPPILDDAEREEMRQYRDEAVRRMQQRNQRKRTLTDTSASINSSTVAENISNPLLEQDRTAPFHDNITIPGCIPEEDKSSDNLPQSSSPEEELVPQLSHELIPPKDEISFQDNRGQTNLNSPTENREETNLSSPSLRLKYCDNLLITSSLSDLGSLEEGSLPTEMNGMPLTSRCEQQITKDLSTLIKHLPDNCSSDNSDFSDFVSASNFDLICESPELDKEIPPVTKSASDEPVICSFLSNMKPNTSDSPLHLPNDTSQNVLRAPIFLTDENGLELHALPAESQSSMQISVNEGQGWIMTSPLIAYVTKKRPETVGMSSNSSQKPIKIQQAGNATFTIDRKDDGEESHLVRPVISSNQDSWGANVCQADYSNNSISPKAKLNQSCNNNNNINNNNNNNSVQVHSSNQEQIITNHQNTNPAVLPANLNTTCNSSKRDKSFIDASLNEPKLEDDERKMLLPFLSSPHNLSLKDHFSDDSLDELLFGIDKIGFVPRKDGDGSDLKDLSNPVKTGAINKKCNSKQPTKTQTSLPTKSIQTNFTTVTTHSSHNLPVSTATVTMADIPNPSEVCSLAEISASDSTANHLNPAEKKIAITSPSLIPKYCSDSLIRRGSYTLGEPSVDLRKYLNNSIHNSHEDKDADNNSSCSDSDKIPTYEDFETQLLKKNSENVSPLPIRVEIDSFKSEQQSTRQNEVKNTSSNSIQHSSPVTKEKIPRNSILENIPLSAASCQSEYSPLNTSRKKSPIKKKEDKCNMNTSALNHTQNGLETSAFKASNSPGQSAVLTSNELFDWEDMFEDELRSFFSEKRQSFMKMQQQFREYEEQFEEEYQRTLDSMKKSQRWPKEFTPDMNIFIPKTDMTGNPTEEQALLNYQHTPESTTSQRKSYKLIKTDQDPASVIGAAIKGFLTRRLLSCPKVEALRKTIYECLKLLSETNDSSNLDLITRLNNQLDAARLDIHDIFFEMTTQERMNIIHQSRILAARKLQARPQQISSATQKYLMRKNQINQSQSVSSSLSDKPNTRNNSNLHPIPSPVQPTRSTTRKISSQQIPKNRIVSVAGKMAATRFVSTKMKDVPSLKIASNKPWR